MRQIEIDGSLAIIFSCNDRLEQLRELSKELQLDMEVLDAKQKELHLEREKVEKRIMEINSKTGAHEENVNETLDLIKKVETSVEFLRTAKSDFGLKMAAQDIIVCRGIIQDWEKETLSHSDPQIKNSEKIHEDSSSQANASSGSKLETTQEKIGPDNILGAPMSSISTNSPPFNGRKGKGIFGASKSTSAVFERTSVSKPKNSKYFEINTLFTKTPSKFQSVLVSSGKTFDSFSCCIATSTLTPLSFVSKDNSIFGAVKSTSDGLFGQGVFENPSASKTLKC
ncbi:unnamed protein product, partial [Meganyctiphanes norvegica]